MESLLQRAALILKDHVSYPEIESSLKSQLDFEQSIVSRESRRSQKALRGDLLNQQTTPDEAEKLRPLCQKEAVRLIVEWLKRPGNRLKNPNDYLWSTIKKVDDLEDRIPLSYRRLTGTSGYSSRDASYHRRIFDNIPEAWVAIHDAAAEEGIDVAIHLIRFPGRYEGRFRSLVQQKCLRLFVDFIVQNKQAASLQQMLKISGVSRQRLILDSPPEKNRIFEGSVDFYSKAIELLQKDQRLSEQDKALIVKKLQMALNLSLEHPTKKGGPRPFENR